MKHVLTVWTPDSVEFESRTQAWMAFLYSPRHRLEEQSWGSYSDHVEHSIELDPQVLRDIEKDVDRTVLLTTRQDQETLSRLLKAYAIRNDVIGYCQGMNAIGAMLLKVLDEETAFWTLACLLELILPGYHTRTMIGLQTDLRVLEHLLEKKLPRLASFMTKHQIEIQHFATKWFVTIFIHTLPERLALRIWDCLLTAIAEGTEACRILFAVAITLLTRLEDTLLATQDPYMLLQILQKYNGNLMSSNEEENFLHQIFQYADQLSISDIHNLRRTIGADVQAETQALDRLRRQDVPLGYVVQLNETLSRRKRLIHRLTKRTSGEYEITFENGPIGLKIEKSWIKSSRVVVKGFERLESGQDGAAKRSGIIGKGDWIVAINGQSCDGFTLEQMTRRMKQVQIRPFTIRFESSRGYSKSFIRASLDEKCLLYDDSDRKKSVEEIQTTGIESSHTQLIVSLNALRGI